MLGPLARRVALATQTTGCAAGPRFPAAGTCRSITNAELAKGHLQITDVEARKSIAKEGRQEFVPDTSTAPEQVYAWMGWSPKPGTPTGRALHSNFPGALPGQAVMHRSSRILKGYGMKPENTLLGLSICPDEINNQVGNLASAMSTYWGEQFPLGGIGGPPFVGKTGFMAFSNHIADNGHIVLLFGPHVGISIDGHVGKVRREGQHKDSTACGAFIAAYGDCISGNHEHDDPDDGQQRYLKAQLASRAESIQKTPEPMAALAVHAYDIVEETMEAIVNNDFGEGYLALIGGVQINMPFGFGDHFWPLKFELRAQNKPTVDLLHAFSCEATGNPFGPGST